MFELLLCTYFNASNADLFHRWQTQWEVWANQGAPGGLGFFETEIWMSLEITQILRYCGDRVGNRDNLHFWL